MNGTKWYKLNKSNEPILVTLHEELHNLERTISDELSSALTTTAEIIFSGLLTYFIDPGNTLWPSTENVPNKTVSFWGTVLSCSVVFLGTIAICKLLVFLYKKIKSTFRDEKKTLAGIYQLERYFYQKVLNEIITGVSLEKKSCELLSEMKDSISPTQDKSLSSIYLVEAVFYFHEALKSINEKNLIEIANDKRQEYTDFLNAVNPEILCEIFLMCEESLSRIMVSLGTTNKSTVESARRAQGLFLMYRKNIHEQMKWPPAETVSLDSSDQYT